ncbi:energy-coupling factor transporter ATPase [Clostridia bacterium]|nr:energy-coupling factor transporter ATPase [Clostridia bacterium]
MSIRLENVSYSYGKNQAIKNVNVDIKYGEFIAIIGHIGSGKSTFIQMLNGLKIPTKGSIYLDGEKVTKKDYQRGKLINKVSIVFQYPEQQLFEKTVIKDVCYGLINRDLSDEERLKKAEAALETVKIDKGNFYSSPFELSGGQKRRVAIAGVLAMDLDVIVLDEPTAGLDPIGKNDILGILKDLNQKHNKTIVLVSHDMNDVCEYADRVIAINKGEIVFDDIPREVFKNKKELESMGIILPEANILLRNLKDKGFSVDASLVGIDETVDEIYDCLITRRCLNEKS